MPAIRADDATIDFATKHQVIRGFGGATVFRPDTPLSDTDLDLLFGTGDGQIGLSILRIRVPTDDYWRGVELANAQGAYARGATLISTPWSPPPEMKTNNSTISGELREDAYAEFATYLNDWALHLEANGAPLYAISIQNEPDYQVTYESCDWSPEQMLKFCREHAGNITATRVIAPESFQFRKNMSDPILHDELATAHVDIIGGHIYGGGLEDYPLARARGKEVWMTEHLVLETEWADVIGTAREIHDCLAEANFSAYIWWYVKRFYGPLDEDSTVSQRGWIMSQFSKYIRPGYHRVEAPLEPTDDVHVSAYAGDNLVIVAINLSDAPVTQTFNLTGAGATTFTPWTTTASTNQSAGDALIVSNDSFTAELPASSVTTFVGAAIYPAPTIEATPLSHTLATGSTAVLRVEASGEQLTYEWSRDGVELPGETAHVLNLSSVEANTAGEYTVTVSNSGGSVTTAPATLTVSSTASPGQLVNLSTRSRVGTVNDVQIGGFVLNGSAPKSMLIRAAGPVLDERFGLTEALTDPVLELYDQADGSLIGSSADWDASLAATFAELGAFEWTTGSRDAAMLVELAPGAYTAQVKGADGKTGVALVEIYDGDLSGTSTRLANLSTRSLVQTGNGAQIAGFVIAGDTSRAVVVRASGPALTAGFSLTGTIKQPRIELYQQATNERIALSTGWDETIAAQFAAVGAFSWPVDSRDAALVTTLAPGAYTVVVTNLESADGIALVEVYTLP